jgi:hypothetical protein
MFFLFRGVCWALDPCSLAQMYCNDSCFLLMKNVLRHSHKKRCSYSMHYTHVCMVLILAASLVKSHQGIVHVISNYTLLLGHMFVVKLWISRGTLVKGIWHSSCWWYHDSINIISCWLYTAYLTILHLPIALAIKVDQASYVLYALVNCIACFSNFICGVLLIIKSRWLCNWAPMFQFQKQQLHLNLL